LTDPPAKKEGLDFRQKIIRSEFCWLGLAKIRHTPFVFVSFVPFVAVSTVQRTYFERFNEGIQPQDGHSRLETQAEAEHSSRRDYHSNGRYHKRFILFGNGRER
jgi:hypothetical protein